MAHARHHGSVLPGVPVEADAPAKTEAPTVLGFAKTPLIISLLYRARQVVGQADTFQFESGTTFVQHIFMVGLGFRVG